MLRIFKNVNKRDKKENAYYSFNKRSRFLLRFCLISLRILIISRHFLGTRKCQTSYTCYLFIHYGKVVYEDNQLKLWQLEISDLFNERRRNHSASLLGHNLLSTEQ